MKNIEIDECPTLCISNAIETLTTCMARAPDVDTRFSIYTANFPQQDNAIFWHPREKLILTEQPIAYFDWMREQLNIRSRNIFPTCTTSSLFTAAMQDPTIVSEIDELAGEKRTVKLITHTTTASMWEMVKFYGQEFGIRFVLPESTIDQGLRDSLDKKSGFRALAAELGFDKGYVRIPRGGTAETVAEAASLVRNFLAEGVPCIVKPDRGEASVGLQIYRPGDVGRDALTEISSNPFLGEDMIVVEEFVDGDVRLPSPEFFVPPPAGGAPVFRYMCEMLFDGPSTLLGNVLSKQHTNELWYSQIVDAGLTIARRIQERGYVGFFDIDMAVGDGKSVYMLDLNPRRNGVTHVHEYAIGRWGSGYLNTISVGNIDLYGIPPSTRLDEVIVQLGELYSVRNEEVGAFPCELSGLALGKCSFLIHAPDSSRLRLAAQDVSQRMQRLIATDGYLASTHPDRN